MGVSSDGEQAGGLGQAPEPGPGGLLQQADLMDIEQRQGVAIALAERRVADQHQGWAGGALEGATWLRSSSPISRPER